MNTRGAGRPVNRLELHLNDISKFKQDVLSVCHNKNTKDKITELIESLRRDLVDTSDHAPDVNEILELISQLSKNDQEDIYWTIWGNLENENYMNIKRLLLQVQSLSDEEQNIFHTEINNIMYKKFNNKMEHLTAQLSSLSTEDQKNIYSALGNQLHDDDKIQFLTDEVTSLSINDQATFYGNLGKEFNEYMWQNSANTNSAQNYDIHDLLNCDTNETFENLDIRLKAFFLEMVKTRRDNSDQIAMYIIQAIDSLFKARNQRHVSLAKIKHHFVALFTSGKSKYVSNILGHIGGHGSRRIIETIMKNSLISCEFKDDKRFTLFISFDNIQSLAKSHRLTSTEREKVYGIIVCSILALLPDGYEVCEVQLQGCNNVAWWFSDFGWDEKSGNFYNKLNTDALKQMIRENNEVSPELLKYWEQDLEREMKHVKKDFDSNMSNTSDINLDSVDMLIKEKANKRVKICTNNHRNENCHPRQKNCKECKEKLVCTLVDDGRVNLPSFADPPDMDIEDDTSPRELFYMKVPSNVPSNCPQQKSMGAIPINPNTRDRNEAVLDYLLEKLNMKDKYSVELEFQEKKVKKTILKHDIRSFILLSTDGLPMKHLIDITENTFCCKECGNIFTHISDIKTHSDETGHKKFFQKYSLFLLNMGNFHYSMAAYR